MTIPSLSSTVSTFKMLPDDETFCDTYFILGGHTCSGTAYRAVSLSKLDIVLANL
jgi:hypothetical protein